MTEQDKTLVEHLQAIRNNVACMVNQVPYEWVDPMVELLDDLNKALAIPEAVAPAGKAVGVIDEGEDGMFVEFYPDKDLPLGALVYTTPPAQGAVTEAAPRIPTYAMIMAAAAAYG